MRQIGTVSNFEHAKKLCDYLLTRDVHAIAEPVAEASETYEIWVRDEDKLEPARSEFEQFVATPDDPKYRVAGKAETIRKTKEKEAKQRAKLNRGAPKSFRRVGAGPLGGPVPITIAVGACCILVTLVTDLVETPISGYLIEKLRFVSVEAMVETKGTDPFASIKQGEVWRLITPVFPHLGMIHLVMNMFGLWIFGSALERLLGRGTYVILLIATALIGNLIQVIFPVGLGGGVNFFGISGVVYGLFGYVLVRGALQPTFPIRLPPLIVVLMLGFMLVGLMPSFQLNMSGGQVGLANGAHIGGFVAGMAAVPPTLNVLKW